MRETDGGPTVRALVADDHPVFRSGLSRALTASGAVEVVGERMGKDAAYMLDSTKLRETLGWQDRVSLDAGLDDCIAWAKRNFDDLKQLPYDYIHKP